MTSRDSASVALDGTRYKSISDRLDAFEEQADGSGGGGINVAVLDEDNGYINVDATLGSSYSVVAGIPTSPPPGGILLPEEGRGSWYLVLFGLDPNDLEVLSTDLNDVGDVFFAAGEFLIQSESGDMRVWHVVPSLVNGGWQAFPVFSAEGLPNSTFTMQVTTSSGAYPAWFLGD